MSGCRKRLMGFAFAASSAWFSLGFSLAVADDDVLGSSGLNGVLASTLLENPTIASQRASVRATHERIAGALSAFFPSADFSYVLSSQEDALTTDGFKFRPSRRTSDSASVSVRYNVFRSGSDDARYRGAISDAESAYNRYSAQAQRILQQAVDSYASILVARRTVRQYEGTKRAYDARLKTTKRRLETGNSTVADLEQIRARSASLEADLSQARSSLETSQERLRDLAIRLPSEYVSPSAISDLPSTLDSAEKRALLNSPLILAARHGADSAKFSRRSAIGLAGPSADVLGRYTYNFQRTGNRYSPPSFDFTTTPPTLGSSSYRSSKSETDSFYGGLTVSVPLYNPSSDSSIRGASATISQRLEELDAARNSVRFGVRSAWSALESSAERIARLKEAVEATKKSLKSIEREYEIGRRLLVDVLDARAELDRFDVALERARGDRFSAERNLLRHMGDLTPSRAGFDLAGASLDAGLSSHRDRVYYHLLPGWIHLLDELASRASSGAR